MPSQSPIATVAAIPAAAPQGRTSLAANAWNPMTTGGDSNASLSMRCQTPGLNEPGKGTSTLAVFKKSSKSESFMVVCFFVGRYARIPLRHTARRSLPSMEQVLPQVTTFLKFVFPGRPPVMLLLTVLAPQQESAWQRSFNACCVWAAVLGLERWRVMAWDAAGSAIETEDRAVTLISASARLRSLVFIFVFIFAFDGTSGLLRSTTLNTGVHGNPLHYFINQALT